MMRLSLALLCSIIFSSPAFAGRISSNPNSASSDPVRSVTIESTGANLYQVLAKTDLETFAIAAASYSDASALADDLQKDSTTICKIQGKLRLTPVTKCKIIEVRFDTAD